MVKLTWLIDTSRECSCSSNRLNCLTGKEWVKAMMGIWEFQYEKRDIRDKTLHPAAFPIALARRVITLFTHKGEVVCDPFLGSGTTLVACQDEGRHGIGFDINHEFCKLAHSRVQVKRLSEFLDEAPSLELRAICANAKQIREFLPDNSVDLIWTSPPYMNILNKPRSNKSFHSSKRHNSKRFETDERYSNDPSDLGNMTPEEFCKNLSEIFTEIKAVLKPGKRVVINVRDVVPIFLHDLVIQELSKLDFVLKNIIIWNKKNLIQRVGIFGYPSNFIALNSAYEYILDFVAPE